MDQEKEFGLPFDTPKEYLDFFGYKSFNMKYLNHIEACFYSFKDAMEQSKPNAQAWLTLLEAVIKKAISEKN